MIDLIVVPDLAAADKAAAGIVAAKIGPPSVSVNADIEARPVVERWWWWRLAGGRRRRLGRFRYDGFRRKPPGERVAVANASPINLYVHVYIPYRKN